MATSVASPPRSLRGAARPRLEGHPPYAYSLGDLAIDFARRAGLVLDPWQADAVILMMACRDDDKWACYEYAEWVPRQNGKGALLEARALAGFFLLGEKLIMWSSHEWKTSIRAFRRMRALIKRLGTQIGNDETRWLVDGIPVKIVNSHGEEGFERLDTEAELKFLARSKGSGRGFTGHVNIIDETFAFTPDQQEALQPTMRAVPNPQVIYTSTPPLNGDSGEIMYELRARAEAKDFDGLGYRDWGLADWLESRETVDLDDRGLWEQTNPAVGDPALGYRISEEAVLRDRRTMRTNGGRGFARECLGMWPMPKTVAGGAIDPEKWEAIQDETSERAEDAPVALGVDIAVERDYASIALYGRRSDGLGHARLVDRRAGTAWIVPRLAELRDELNPVTVAMNRATFASLATELRDKGFEQPEDPDDPWHGELLVMTATDQAAACGQIIDDVRGQKVDGELRQPFRVKPDPEQPETLDDAVVGAKTRRAGDTIAWSRTDDDTEISPLAALTAARFGHVTRVKATEVETLEGSLMA